MTSLEEEIEKYRSLYNDIRSKYTILSADFEHQQIEHRDQIDSVQLNFTIYAMIHNSFIRELVLEIILMVFSNEFDDLQL